MTDASRLLAAARAHDDASPTTLASLVSLLAHEAADTKLLPLHGALPLLRGEADADRDPLLVAFCDAAEAFLTDAT